MARNRGWNVSRIDESDIVGKRFGKLLVVRHSKRWHDETAGGEKMRHSYSCVCDCGKSVEVRRSNLLYGYTKSCGCLRTGRRKKYGY